MPIFLTHAELLNFSMFFIGALCAWAVVKGMSDD
jgi:hypothetical protein